MGRRLGGGLGPAEASLGDLQRGAAGWDRKTQVSPNAGGSMRGLYQPVPPGQLLKYEHPSLLQPQTPAGGFQETWALSETLSLPMTTRKGRGHGQRGEIPGSRP